MNYTHEAYAFQARQQAQPMFFQPAPYPPAYMQQHPPQFEEVYASYPHSEWGDNLSGGLYQEEYEDGGEVSTRPRLTREQVEVLETQFQANHKPSSSVKRQLAAQTNLSLPRVAVSSHYRWPSSSSQRDRTGSRTGEQKLNSSKSKRSLRTAN